MPSRWLWVVVALGLTSANLATAADPARPLNVVLIVGDDKCALDP